MKITKSEKGITLIALIITIVILLILAVVTIGAVKEDGIIGKAKYARDEYERAQAKENSILQGYLDQLNDNTLYGNSGTGNTGNENTGDGSIDDEETGNGTSGDRVVIIPDTTMEEAQDDSMLNKEVNSSVIDKYENPIIVPAGFKILVDDTTGYTADTIDVTKGIVIEDASGNQFVWVPVGNIYYSETEYKTITLGRYWGFGTNDNGEYVPVQTVENYETAILINDKYTEDTAANHNSVNAIAKDIGEFLESTITKGGYYLGRFEAGNLNDTLVCKANQTVYEVAQREVGQTEASRLSQSMYASSNFTSDLVNSYAWDTAIVFIQTFGGVLDYSFQNFSTSFFNTGINDDKYCNIHDMSGNAFEYTTESSTGASSPRVARGGYYDIYNGDACYYTSIRDSITSPLANRVMCFRPILYVAL